MTIEELIQKAILLEAEIAEREGEERFELHRELHRVITRVQALGGEIPGRLKSLDHELLEEEVEDGFDNMPV